GDGAAGKLGEMAGFDGERLAAQGGLEHMRHGYAFLLLVRRRDRWLVGRRGRQRVQHETTRATPGSGCVALAAKSEPCDHGAVARIVLLDQIGKKAAALADELEETAARMIVLRKAPEMLRQALDPLRQERDLDFRGA